MLIAWHRFETINFTMVPIKYKVLVIITNYLCNHIYSFTTRHQSSFIFHIRASCQRTFFAFKSTHFWVVSFLPFLTPNIIPYTFSVLILILNYFSFLPFLSMARCILVNFWIQLAISLDSTHLL